MHSRRCAIHLSRSAALSVNFHLERTWRLLRVSIRNQNHARHGCLIPQICWQATSDSEAGIASLGSLLIQTIDCMFFGLATPKVLLVSDRIRWRGCEEFGVFSQHAKALQGSGSLRHGMVHESGAMTGLLGHSLYAVYIVARSRGWDRRICTVTRESSIN